MSLPSVFQKLKPGSKTQELRTALLTLSLNGDPEQTKRKAGRQSTADSRSRWLTQSECSSALWDGRLFGSVISVACCSGPTWNPFPETDCFCSLAGWASAGCGAACLVVPTGRAPVRAPPDRVACAVLPGRVLEGAWSGSLRLPICP